MHPMQLQVSSFHSKHDLPQELKRIEIDDRLLLRVRLINEELSELTTAIHEGNVIETADALGDLYYVIVGTGVTYGIELSLADPLIPEHKPVVRPYFATYILLRLTKSVGFLAESFISKSKAHVKVRLEEVALNCINIADECEFPFTAVFNEIHRSNMTKPKLDKHNKGGKGDGFSPVDLRKILENGNL